MTSGPIAGVKSCDALDVENYDNSNYRDDFFNAKTGGSNILVDIAGSTTPTNYVVKSTEAGVETIESIQGTGGASVQSATDAALHVAPRNEAKMRTQIRLWSGTPGSSDVLYSGWADEIVSFSLAPYTFI